MISGLLRRLRFASFTTLQSQMRKDRLIGTFSCLPGKRESILDQDTLEPMPVRDAHVGFHSHAGMTVLRSIGFAWNQREWAKQAATWFQSIQV